VDISPAHLFIVDLFKFVTCYPTTSTDLFVGPILQGKKVTGFSNAEEYAVAKEDLVPFMLETKLKWVSLSHEFL
jgi:hypothetical protein